MEFKDRLALLIEASGKSLSQISKDTGIPKSSLHNLVVGTEPTMSKLIQLGKYFDVSIDYLVLGKVFNDPIEELFKDEIFKGMYEVTVKKVIRGNT